MGIDGSIPFSSLNFCGDQGEELLIFIDSPFSHSREWSTFELHKPVVNLGNEGVTPRWLTGPVPHCYGARISWPDHIMHAYEVGSLALISLELQSLVSYTCTNGNGVARIE